MSWKRALERWERLIGIIEDMGFVEDWRAEKGVRWTYSTRGEWLGEGSEYITLRDREDDVAIDVRISDHAPVEGGGMRYDSLVGSHYRAGDSDVSIHPGSEVTLRNVRRYIEAALERARQELDEDF